MPPSPPVSDTGVWRTAQRTSRKSATIGIFRQNISQMNVQASTATIVYPVTADHNPVAARPAPPPQQGEAAFRRRSRGR